MPNVYKFNIRYLKVAVGFLKITLVTSAYSPNVVELKVELIGELLTIVLHLSEIL